MNPDNLNEPSFQARLKSLTRFVPAFIAPGFQFATLHKPPPEPSGLIELPYYELSPEASAFVAAAHKFGWVTWMQWSAWRGTERTRALMESPDRIGEATPDELSRLLTVYIRGNRFNDGYLKSAFDSGVIVAIVKRAEDLLDDCP